MHNKFYLVVYGYFLKWCWLEYRSALIKKQVEAFSMLTCYRLIKFKMIMPHDLAGPGSGSEAILFFLVQLQ